MPTATRKEHYRFEKKERELRERLRSQALALADRSAGSRDYAAAVAEFARGRAELRRDREARTRDRLRRQAAGRRPAPWDSPRALERRRVARTVAEARWADWADRTVLAARAGAPLPAAPGERGRSAAPSGRLCRRSLSAAPDADALRAAWTASRGGRTRTPEKIRLGSLLLDLEATLGNARTRGADGRIAGRAGGLRGWLAWHAPDLAGRYDSLLRARRLAQAVRRAHGLDDPLPASLLLDGGETGADGFPAPLRERVKRARAVARALFSSPAGHSMAALRPALARRTPPA